MFDTVIGIINYIQSTFSANYFILVLIAILIGIKYVSSMNPIPEIEGSLVQNITDRLKWNIAVEKARDTGGLVVVDFYANWCPPCKRAAPIFAHLSKDFCEDPELCQFWKIDVDKVPEVSKYNDVKMLPTFKFFKNAVEVDEIVGWDELKLISMIKKHWPITKPNVENSKSKDH